MRLLRTALILTGLHLAAVLSLQAMGVDSEGAEPSGVAQTVADVLMQPGATAWEAWGGPASTKAQEWVVLVGNSLLWGVVLSVLLLGLRPAKRKRKKLLGPPQE